MLQSLSQSAARIQSKDLVASHSSADKNPPYSEMAKSEPRYCEGQL